MDGVVEKPGDLDAFPPGLFSSVRRGGRRWFITISDDSTAPVTMSFDNGRLVVDGGAEATRLSNLLES